MDVHAESINLGFDQDVFEEVVRFRMIARFADFCHACACREQDFEVCWGMCEKVCLQTVTVCYSNDQQ